jgi:hypothetical protein
MNNHSFRHPATPNVPASSLPGRVFWQWPLLARRSPSTRRRAGSDDATRAGICQIRVAREIRRTGVVAHRLRVRWVVVYVEQVGDGHAPLWENGIPLVRLVGTRARFSKERMAPPAWVWGDERVADWTDSPTPPRNAERAPPRDGIGSSASPPQICRGGTEPPRQRPQQARRRLIIPSSVPGGRLISLDHCQRKWREERRGLWASG